MTWTFEKSGLSFLVGLSATILAHFFGAETMIILLLAAVWVELMHLNNRMAIRDILERRRQG